MKKLLFILFTILFANYAVAGLFQPKPIEVNEKSTSVVEAKKQAFAKAKRQAWLRLVQSMGVDKSKEAGNIEENELDALIESIQIGGEKARSKRYIANITIYFNPEKVRNFLSDNGITFVEERGFPVLIVPVYEESGVSYIYENNNLWEKSLQDNPKKTGLLPIMLAEGGVRNSLKIDNFSLTNEKKLLNEAKNYGVEGVVITRVVMVSEKLGSYSMELYYQSIGGFLQNQMGIITQKGDKLTKEETLKKITNKFYIQLEAMWQKKLRENISTGKNTQIVILSTESIEDLNNLKQSISEIENIKKIDLYGLNGGLAKFELDFLGPRKKLKIAFERLGYIVDNKYDKWLIKRPN